MYTLITKSEDSLEGNSTKKIPTVCDILPGETIPDWADKLFGELRRNINDMYRDFQCSLEFSTDTSTQALSETGVLKALFKVVCHKLDNVEYQMSHITTENATLREKVNSLENKSRRDNLLFTGFKEEKGETEDMCKAKIYEVLRYKCCIPVERLDAVRVVRCLFGWQAQAHYH